MNRTAVAIRHLAFEDLGSFEPVLEEFGYTIRYHDIGLNDLGAIDPETNLLIVLGGPIGVYEEATYPFLKDEIALLEKRLLAGWPTMGICLGAQLIARALGARVFPGPEKEIGFAPIALTDAGEASCLVALKDGPVLHWHGDTFDLPTGAVRLASTRVCENQAFSYGQRVIAFQFHPEAGSIGFERWLIGHTVELAAARKSVTQLRADYQAFAPDLRLRAEICAGSWLKQIL